MPGIDSFTKLLLHCDGTDTSTTFIDDSDSSHSVTANGTAQIDIAVRHCAHCLEYCMRPL